MAIPDRQRDDPPFPTRVVLKPIGNPMPLGLLGLTIATLAVAGLDLGWVPTGEQHQVGLVLIFFAFPLQGLATIFGFLARDAVVASGFGVQSASWLTFGVLQLTSHPGSRSHLLALFLFAAAAALVSAVSVAAHSKLVPALVMAGTVVRFVLTGVYQWSGNHIWRHASGWEGVALAVLALYTAVALDIESAQMRTVLPLGRFGRGKQAVRGSADAQVSDVEHEAGVREQL